MEIVLFTKLFGERPPAEVAEIACGIGFDGVDLLIRSGATVNPAGAPENLSSAVDALNAAGLSVPIATTDLTNPADPSAKPVLGACADAGIGLVRLGYWTYDGDRRYSDVLDDARHDLSGMADLARSVGVRVAVQLHGGTIHASGATTLALLDGQAPDVVAAYSDPGNQAVQDGREDWRLTLDVLEPWLRCVGVKNGGWAATTTDGDGQRRWSSSWTPLAAGMVPWPDILAHLTMSGYSGVLSLHSHYHLPFEHIVDETRTDLRYVRRLLAREES